MPSNAFTPSKLDVVNQVLSELGRLPVDNIDTDDQAQIVSKRLDTLLPEFLLRTPWNIAIKYVTDNTPLTQNFSPEFVYTFQLPFDYGRMFKFWQMWYDYEILDNFLLSNQRPVMYYYVVNNIDYDLITPLFMRCLVLYTASTVSMVLTQDLKLTQYLYMAYKEKLNDAILQNDMDRRVQATPHNDFDRLSYI